MKNRPFTGSLATRTFSHLGRVILFIGVGVIFSQQAAALEMSPNFATELNQMGPEMKASELVRHAALGDASMVRALLEAGVAPGAAEPSHQQTALIAAASQGHSRLIKMLLTAGAPLDAQDRRGVTALIAAASAGHHEAVQLLLAAGAQPDIRPTNASTALVIAAWKGKTRVVNTLLLAGADPGQADAFGLSALDAARMAQRQDIVQKLTETIEAGKK